MPGKEETFLVLLCQKVAGMLVERRGPLQVLAAQEYLFITQDLHAIAANIMKFADKEVNVGREEVCVENSCSLSQ